MLPLLLNATPTSFPLVLHNRNILSILPEFPHKLFYMIKEKVSSSQSVKLITWTVIPVIIIFGLLIPIHDFMHTTHTVMQVLYGTVVILVFMMLNAVLFYAPKEVILDDTRLTLIKGAGKLTILRNEIEEIRMYDPRDTGNIRVFGIGGICGYIGRYYNRDIGYYTSFVGDYSQAFFIRTKKGKKYLFSCDNAGRIVEELEKRYTK